MLRFACLFVIAGVSCWSMFAVVPDLRGAEPLERYGNGSAPGSSAAVVFHDATLLFSGQLFPRSAGGMVVATTADQQTKYLLARVEAALGSGTRQRVGKINLVATSEEAALASQKVLSDYFPEGLRPAVSYVVGKLPDAETHVALDFVALDTSEVDRSATRVVRKNDDAYKAVLLSPDQSLFSSVTPGSLVFVSGQAEKGEDITEATHQTMESLSRTLTHLGLTFDDVVSVRSFLSPMSETANAVTEIQKYYTGPQSVVEWLAPGTIEIELIAAAPPPAVATRQTVEYLTPPGMQASPVFSRVTRTHGKTLIFVSNLYGRTANAGGDEVTEIFSHLEQTLQPLGSNLRHLAKATYFVSTNDASMKLNELRPKYYDPQRPPAASKATVQGTGRPGRTVTLDMIAVPAPRD